MELAQINTPTLLHHTVSSDDIFIASDQLAEWLDARIIEVNIDNNQITLQPNNFTPCVDFILESVPSMKGFVCRQILI